jgi:hypothetical protein
MKECGFDLHIFLTVVLHMHLVEPQRFNCLEALLKFDL